MTLLQNCGLELGHFKFNDEILSIFLDTIELHLSK